MTFFLWDSWGRIALEDGENSYWWMYDGTVGYSQLEPKTRRRHKRRGVPMLMDLNLIFQDPNWNVSKPHDTSVRRGR